MFAADAAATSYLFTTNRDGGYADSGVKIAMATKALTLNGTYYSGVPCDSSDTSVAWSPHGDNIGMSRDYQYGSTYPYIWVGISSSTNGDCGASAGEDCVGIAKYDVSGSSLTQTYETNNTFTGSGAIVPDQLGNVTLVAVGEKSQSDEYKWTTAATNGSKISVTPTNLSQMAWVDGTLFGATMAGGTSCSGGGYQGALEIRSRTSGSVIDAKTIPLVGTNSWAKPEGIAIVPVNGSHSGC